MSNKIIYSNMDRFDQDVLASPIPVALDFYSEDCPPCSALAPIFDRMAEIYHGQMRFVKVMRQANRPLAERLNVRSSPTVLFLHQGQEIAPRLNGYIKKPQIRKTIDMVLGIKSAQKELKTVWTDVIVLGGGPAGLTAALYTARAKLNTVVIEEGLSGGQASTTFHIANYPGTGGVVEGKILMENMVRQAQSFGAHIHDLKEVFSIDLTGSIKTVVTEDTVYKGKALIIATGAEPRLLPAEGEADFRGRGVHYCATCDGAMYQGANLIVVGGGNSAVEEAIFLTRFAEKVTIIHEFDTLQASKIAQEEALHHGKIDFIWQSHVKKIKGNGHLTGVTIENRHTGEISAVSANGVFVYIGTKPKTELFQGQLGLNSGGYIITDAEMRTTVPGVFAAGDVREKMVRQVVTAVGDGATAAVMAERYLAEQEARG